MATLKELNSQLAAAQKKHGAKSQAAGRIQYKINQLNKDSKGTVVKTKDGKAVKSKTGVVRQNDTSKKKRKSGVKKLTKDRNPNTVVKKKDGKVTVTGLNGKSRKVKAGSADKVITPVQKKNDKGLEKPKPSRMVRKGKGHPSAEMFAYVQNIDKKPSVKKKK
tara:strand:+ start:278 stop:766 length:489 start_codon:yes stop_codon:yes gene_type:complete